MERNPNFAYTLKQTSQFKKDLKSVKFDDNKLNELQIIFEHLGRTGEVPAEYLPHPPNSSTSNGSINKTL